jgi:predicted lipoprotein with Yx(FWY)xxD motif
MNKSKQEERTMAMQPRIIVTGRRPVGSWNARQCLRPARCLTTGIALAAIGLLAACGSSEQSGDASGSHATATSHRTIVAVRDVPGVGSVLVDSSGDTLYSPQQEANGKILCTATCLSFWFPVHVSAGATLRAPGSVTGKLGTIHQPGGVVQLTINGRPLYTFRLDQAAGQAHGNDYTDRFGGVSFTWHAITASGTPAAATQKSSSAPGYGSSGGGAGGY